MRLSGRARSIVGESARLNLDQATLPGALRCTAGALVPLVVGLATGAVADGVYGSIGALCAGFASFQGAYRRRVLITFAVGVGMAAATISGGLAGRADWAAIVAVAVWSLIAGMMTAFGQPALVVGLQWGVAVIIVNAFPMTASQALDYGGMILAGALVQSLLVVVTWPLRSYAAERGAVADLYRDLASYAESVTRGVEAGLPSTAIDDARAVLRDPQPLGRAAQLVAFQALVDEAARSRIALAALSSMRRSLQRGGSELLEIDSFLLACASVLRSVATAVLADMEPAGTASLARLATERPPPQAHGATPWQVRETTALMDALAGQLRGMVRTASVSADGKGADDNGRHALPRRRRNGLPDAVLTLRANLSWQSAVFRHAVRLSAVLTLGMILYRVTGLAHGYWISLTALLVLRQDFTTTAVRGISRVAGTVLGALVATLLVVAIRPDQTGLAVLFALSAFSAFVTVRVNYALFSVFVTAYVVFLLAFAAEPAVSTAGARLVATLVGGALAIGAYLAWPTWESRLAAPQLARLVDAQADYAEALLACFSEPASARRRSLDEMRSAVRRARSNAELSLARMASEPARSRRDAPLDLDRAGGIAAAARRSSLSLLTLHARLPGTTDPPFPAVSRFARQLVARMRREAAQLRDLVRRSAVSESPEALFALGGRSAAAPETQLDHLGRELREAHNELVADLAGVGGRDPVELQLLTTETDELVDAVNSISRLVAAQAE